MIADERTLSTTLRRGPSRSASASRPAATPPDEPEPDEPTDLDDQDIPCTDDDDSRWEAFVPDDDERDPEPAPGDFWIERTPELEFLTSD